MPTGDLSDTIVSLVIAAVFVFLGAAAVKVRIDLTRTAMAVAAAGLVVIVISAIIREPLAKWALESMSTNSTAPLLAAIGINLAIWLVSLAITLNLVIPVSGQMATGLALFSTGASIAAYVGYVLLKVGTAILQAPGAFTAGWVALGAGIILALIGFGTAATATEISPRPSKGPAPSPSLAPIQPITFAPSAEPMTQSRQETVVHAQRAKPAAKAWLVVSIGKSKGQRFDVVDGDSKVGRGKSCEILITGDDEVSREHSLIRGSKSHFQLYDLASRNGTYLNGDLVKEPRTLQDGDEIQLGDTTLVFKTVD